MYRPKRDSVILLIVLLLFSLLSFYFNGWLSATMVHHQIIQLPSMLLLGIICGINFSWIIIKDTSWGIAFLIFIMTSFIFWMLPHSVDYAVINPGFNRIMHLDMMLCGFLMILVLKSILFEIKILFLGMLSAMLLATGITLRAYNILLCSSFNIAEQKETGFYLILAGMLLFIATFIIFFKNLGGRKIPVN